MEEGEKRDGRGDESLTENVSVMSLLMIQYDYYSRGNDTNWVIL